MSSVELIAELTDICIRQAEIIKAQAFLCWHSLALRSKRKRHCGNKTG